VAETGCDWRQGGRQFLVQHNIESQVYIARAIYVGGTGGVMGGRAGYVRARGGWCSLGELTADFWGIRLVRACLEDIWASVCSASKLRTPPDKGGGPSSRGSDGGHGGEGPTRPSPGVAFGSPVPSGPSLSIKAHSSSAASLAPGFSALAHTGTGAGARRRGPLPSWCASLSHCLAQSDKLLPVGARSSREAHCWPTAGGGCELRHPC
jgi:hypothetical protein